MRRIAILLGVFLILFSNVRSLIAQKSETTKCVFIAERLINSELEPGYVSAEVPFADCWVYIFRLEKGKDEQTFAKPVEPGPAKTDENGLCSFEFLQGAPYYVYFAGELLNEDQQKRILREYEDYLYRVEIGGEQSEQSDFRAQTGERLKLKIKYSMAHWLVLIQKLEKRVQMFKASNITIKVDHQKKPVDKEPSLNKSNSTKEFISQLRMLYFVGPEWSQLIPTDTRPLYSYDNKTGRVMDRSGVFEICQLLGPKYRTQILEDTGLALELDGEPGERDRQPIVDEECDLVTVRIRDGASTRKQMLRISKVIAALDCQHSGEGSVVSEPVIVVTFGRSVSLTMITSVKKWNQRVTLSDWRMAVRDYCSNLDLVSDVIADNLMADAPDISVQSPAAYLQAASKTLSLDYSRLQLFRESDLLWSDSPRFWGEHNDPKWQNTHNEVRGQLIRQAISVISAFLNSPDNDGS